MTGLLKNIWKKLPTDIFTDNELVGLLEGTKDRRYGLVKRALKKGEIVQLRKGVYLLGPDYQRKKPNLFEMAQKIYHPSYISVESALSHHGWIPEATYTVTSISLKRSAEFETPLGLFAYNRIPNFNYIGVERLSEGGSPFFMACPTKALIDYVYANKIDVQKLSTLIDGLRIEPGFVKELSQPLIAQLAEVYEYRNVQRFIKLVAKELKG